MSAASIYLYLSITTFTPSHGITTREIFIPFASRELCEAALRGAMVDHIIGDPADSGACVTALDKPLNLPSWPRPVQRKR